MNEIQEQTTNKDSLLNSGDRSLGKPQNHMRYEQQ